MEFDSGAEAMLAEYLDTAKWITVKSFRPEGYMIMEDILSKRTEDKKLDEVILWVAYDVYSARKAKESAVYTPDFIIEINKKEYIVECKNKYEITHDRAYVLRKKLFMQKFPEKRFLEFMYMWKSKGFECRKYF